jgi:hypothetical protein
MERDEDGVVLGSSRLAGSQRLHRKGDATREAGSLVGPMTAADSLSAISVFRFKDFCCQGSLRRPCLQQPSKASGSDLQGRRGLARTVTQAAHRLGGVSKPRLNHSS